MSRLTRLLNRPSSRLVRALLIPLSVIQILVTVYLVILANRTAGELAYDRMDGMVQALAMSEPPASGVLTRTAEWVEADRLWIVSATGRILASNRGAEVNGLVDDIWWQDLPTDQRRVRRSQTWGGRRYVQVAYHDIERGAWAMAIADLDSPIFSATARIAALLLFSLTIWLIVAGTVIAVIRRTVGRALDVSDLVASRALRGEVSAPASLARLRPAMDGFGPAGMVLQLVERMQERAIRANEAESRFSLAVELLPGIAYLASYDGALLYAGPLLRQRLGPESQVGRSVEDLLPELPLARVHTAAEKSRTRGVTFDNLPVSEADGERPAMRASIRAVAFRGVPAYMAHIEAVNDAGDSTAIDREAEGLEQQLLQGAQEIIIAFDGNTRTLVWNAAAERFCRAGLDEVPDLRSAVDHLFSTASAQEAFHDWMDARPELEPLEIECASAEGSVYRVRWTARELRHQGRVVGGALFGIASPMPDPDRPARRVSLARRRYLFRNRTAETQPSETGEETETDEGLHVD
ncbi:MAG: hypothetical protein JJ896_13135 [Rhodothermales bacterium]|nr:hypothetical protein [Rhodothermales bacterium]MBO6780590.1 hypothetical protein [Rhodothermales bacterium]